MMKLLGSRKFTTPYKNVLFIYNCLMGTTRLGFDGRFHEAPLIFRDVPTEGFVKDGHLRTVEKFSAKQKKFRAGC